MAQGDTHPKNIKKHSFDNGVLNRQCQRSLHCLAIFRKRRLNHRRLRRGRDPVKREQL